MPCTGPIQRAHPNVGVNGMPYYGLTPASFDCRTFFESSCSSALVAFDKVVGVWTLHISGMCPRVVSRRREKWWLVRLQRNAVEGVPRSLLQFG